MEKDPPKPTPPPPLPTFALPCALAPPIVLVLPAGVASGGREVEEPCLPGNLVVVEGPCIIRPGQRRRAPGQLAEPHGVKRAHRRPGSIGGHATNLGTGPKVKKGKKMAGRMGGEQVTVRSLDVIHADPEKNLLVVKGPVPGPNGCDLYVKPAVRLYKSKAHKQAKA